MGPSIKDVSTRGERGVSQKRTHADAGAGEGGKWQNADVLKNSNFYQNFRNLCVMCAKRQHSTQ